VKVSIIIPTFNRLSELGLVLEAVQRQEVPEYASLEVVVIDDGSTDGTWAWLRRQRWSCAVTLLRQENSGPARARNRGVETATGNLVLFLGDDTIPQPGWLLCHLEEHRIEESQVAVLGYTSFPPESDTPFRAWINELGAQFGYQLIESPRHVPFNFFYTSNISLPRSVLVELGGFREDFPAAAWEDIELAYRATLDGLRMVYQPRARTLHLHPISPRSFCRRQRISGRSAAIFAELHPELAGFLGLNRCQPGHRFFAVVLEWVLLALVSFAEHVPGAVPARGYQRLLDLAYLQGLRSGLRSSEMSSRTGFES
jgi:GT2 family glycosyltransferase